MKTKPHRVLQAAVLFIAMAIHSNLNAQTDSEGSFAITNIYVGSFLSGFSSSHITGIDTWATRYSESDILQNRLAWFGKMPNQAVSGSSFGMFSAQIGFGNTVPKSGFLSRPEFRVGINYFNSNVTSHGHYRQTTTRIDTLTNSANTRTMYMDSTHWRTLFVSSRNPVLNLDMSMIFRTKSEARVSFFGGIGLMAGVAFNGFDEIVYTESSRYEYKNSDGTELYQRRSFNSRDEEGFFESESYQNEGFFTGAVYLPFGLDFKVSRDHDFWSRVNLFLEVRPSLGMFQIGDQTVYAARMGSAGLGIRLNVI